MMMLSLLTRLRAWWSSLGFPPAPFRQRPCQGAAWRETFPQAPKQDIRDVLELFVRAFAFRSSSRFSFAPDDTILSVYRALYPSRWTPDALEIETLSKLVARRYGIRLAEVWRSDLTLGELFALATSSS